MGIDAVEWAQKVERLGAGEILLTSMDCDGTKAGYDLELQRQSQKVCQSRLSRQEEPENWNILRCPYRRKGGCGTGGIVVSL